MEVTAVGDIGFIELLQAEQAGSRAAPVILDRRILSGSGPCLEHEPGAARSVGFDA